MARKLFAHCLAALAFVAAAQAFLRCARLGRPRRPTRRTRLQHRERPLQGFVA
jgi:hypothetical protein